MSRQGTSEGRAALAAEHASLLILLAACVAHYWICVSLTSEIALDVDPINLLYGMREFNVAHHAPHPPGYLVYVWMLRGLHGIVGGLHSEFRPPLGCSRAPGICPTSCANDVSVRRTRGFGGFTDFSQQVGRRVRRPQSARKPPVVSRDAVRAIPVLVDH